MDYEVVLFDLDGVLADSLGTIERILRDWAAANGIDGDRAVALSHGRRDVDLIRLLAPRLDAEAEAALIVAREETDTAGVRAAPGAARLLGTLTPRMWAIVTSGTRAVATARLRASGLPVPGVLVAADDVAVGKPDPTGYRLAARLMGRPPERCLVVEDAVAGAEAARAAGMDCLGVGPALEGSPLVVAWSASLAEARVDVSAGGISLGVGSTSGR
ncbi:HAD-IA family hydrolase [Actinomadura oligospora]|uniref:HAD-IA family hydrolase n=1 Tax=Actinomadura oligospora TaxID=111804 RepID=UPI00047C93F5|nr:HAD-IA family hydrolase [Actinomadura oligospora]